MVLGIISTALCCCVGPITGIIGLVLGISALSDIKTGYFASSSRGMAITGIVCSSIGLVIGGGYWLIHFVPLLF